MSVYMQALLSVRMCHSMPSPPPAWVQFVRNSVPYPNLVVEVTVAVNKDGPAKLQADCHRCFGNSPSVKVWIGIKVWVKEEKFWVGWAERVPAGNRATIHSAMRFTPHYSPINTTSR